MVRLLLLLLIGVQAHAAGLPELRVRTWLDEEVAIRDLTQDHPLTLLNVWAVWCPPCREELPVLLEGHEAGLYRLVALNLGDNPDSVASFLFSLGLEALPTYFLSVRFGARLGVPGLPTTLVLDREAQVLRTHYGAIDAEGLAALLRDLGEMD